MGFMCEGFLTGEMNLRIIVGQKEVESKAKLIILKKITKIHHLALLMKAGRRGDREF
jgi:hypothetical protein